MAVSKSACALALLAVVLAAGAADANHGNDDYSYGRGHGKNYKAPRDYLVQGQSRYQENLPKDPTPLAPTTKGPYALAHRGSSGAAP